MTTPHNAVIAIAEALIEAIKVAGTTGVSGGTLYAATMHVLSLDQFNWFMGVLVESGKVKRSGHWYTTA